MPDGGPPLRGPSCPGARVLVADDQEGGRLALQVYLEGEGYRVSTACDGEEAYALALDRRPDLVITDVLMPRLDGFDLCRRIRATRALRDVPIVIVTALEIGRAHV